MKHTSKLFLGMIIFSVFAYSCSKAEANIQSNLNFNRLTDEEAYIMLEKGTEKPYSGVLLYNKEDGKYICKQCNNVLFLSNTKFDSKTGWPSFDEAVANAVKEVPDFLRTEIVCASCEGHLGHVFLNEGFTEKQARYCINSLSLNFVATSK